MKISRKSSEFKKLQNICENSSKKIKYSFNAYGFRKNIFEKRFRENIFEKCEILTNIIFCEISLCFCIFASFISAIKCEISRKSLRNTIKFRIFSRNVSFAANPFVPYIWIQIWGYCLFSSLISGSFCTETTIENY